MTLCSVFFSALAPQSDFGVHVMEDESVVFCARSHYVSVLIFMAVGIVLFFGRFLVETADRAS